MYTSCSKIQKKTSPPFWKKEIPNWTNNMLFSTIPKLISSQKFSSLLPLLTMISSSIEIIFIVKRGRREVFQKSMFFCFSDKGEFLSLQKWEKFSFRFWARRVLLYEVCFLLFLFLFFQTTKHFWWVCQCVHQGGDCKIKGVFYYYSMTNNWHRRYIYRERYRYT